MSSSSQNQNVSTTEFQCTICLTTPPPTLCAEIPLCSHVFCLSCLLSWSHVNPTCPLCKSPFTTLLVSRDLTGAPIPGPYTRHQTPPRIPETLALLLRVDWVSPREVLPPLHDLLPPTFVLPHPSIPVSPAPQYLHEEVEDELEHRFWEEEERQFDRLIRGRVLSNRRFGTNGYISAGRLHATPRAPATPHKILHPTASRDSGSGAGSADRQSVTPRPAGRKKKLKKKSREGIAAAARKKAEAEAAAAAAASAADAGVETDVETDVETETV